jgi:hypothetical protein
MVLRTISPKIKTRFPTLESLHDASYLENDELRMIRDFNTAAPAQQTHWLPIVWAVNIVKNAHKSKIINDSSVVRALNDELLKFCSQCGILLNCYRPMVPLGYTQVSFTTLASRSSL